MSDFLFDTPRWVFAVFAVTAAALLLQGNVRQNNRLKWAGLGVILAGVVLALLSYFVDTDKEKCIKRTRALVAAVQDHNDKVLQNDLSQSVTLGAWDRADILASYATEQSTHGVREIKITSIEAVQTDTVVTVTLGIVTHLDAAVYADVPTAWSLDWQQSAEGWHVTRIHLVEIGAGPAARGGESLENELFGQHVTGR